MSKPKFEGLSRREFLGGSVGAVVGVSIGCGDSNETASRGSSAGGSGGNAGANGASPSGGELGTGGTSSALGTGGSSQTASGGNMPGSGGASPVTTGGASQGTGGVLASGGSSATGGAVGTSTAGATTGGTSSTGGAVGTTGGGDGTSGGTSPGGGGSPGGGTPGGGAESAGSSATGGSAPTGGASASGGTSVSGGGSSSAGAAGGSGVDGSTPLVALVRDSDVNKAVKDAIEAVGGFPDLTGKTVLLRPNAIIADGPPYTTGAEVVRAVIQAIKAKGSPAAILVGEDSLAGDTAEYMRANGIYEAATSEGATPLDMSSGPTRTVTPEGATNWPDGITCYESFLDADYVINMPVCKSHSYANYTMAIKAWYGNQTNYRNTHPTNLPPALAELHLARKSDFIVLDATKTLLNGGPFAGTDDIVASPGIIVASRDTVAADVTGLCIMKHYLQLANQTGGAINNLSVWKQPQIMRAMALTALGWTTDKAFAYAAQGIDEAATIMAYRDA